MKKKWILGVGVMLCSQLAFIGIASADTTTGYSSANDTMVNVSTGSSTSTLVPSTGTTLFQTQEGVYQLTGTSVDHGYVWVDVNGTPVLALDPPHANFS